ncbi:glutaminyl-tRNA synthetase [Diplogelasinospora grovesii]|uniref:glutamine--tRNA ligase n=1 Tax=Diplogelasinospora grovesii TaxID=303347 RepID=A0AAN6N7G4_9PEZI|nr:glutaminyl-tRNA synthetase [Diplogelasinospora grovesii]
MADTNDAPGGVKLQLDETTGEWVSKNALKKRMQKRAKKAAAEARAKPPQPATKTTQIPGNFDRLYDLAEKLIHLEKAYVCHCPDTETKRQRGGEDGKEGPKYRCSHANQDVETNLNKFRGMRDGHYAPQTVFLRMKQDITSGNPRMWDPAAYRIPKTPTPHYRTDDKWKIYPTYDFAHCLCDSFEGTLGVTHEPMQREYGRLDMAGTVVSKRYIKAMIDARIVGGYDDPRLYTLAALRRRGVPPGAILSFINELGVTPAKTVIQVARFEQAVRKYLETRVPRLMMVLDPIPVTIENWHRKNGGKLASRTHQKTRAWKEEREYFRLAPGRTAGLLGVSYPIKTTSFSTDLKDPDRVTEVRTVLDKETKKPKTFIQWGP